MRAAALVAFALLVAGCTQLLPPSGGPPSPAPAPPQRDGKASVPPPGATPPRIALQQVASGFRAALYVTDAGDDSGRLFVVEQGGTIKVLKNSQVQPVPFLDLSALVTSGGERGLLSMAFDPQFAANHRFYVDYTDLRGDTVVARYTTNALGLGDPASGTTLLHIAQPYANHNGGLVRFGPDGLLYVGMGDGGSGGDPQNRAQNPDELLGKLLRLDVRGAAYAIPPDNPFAGGGGKPEIWALGLRNPWRFTWDRATDDLYLGDVGQNAWEEVDFMAAGQGRGANYGWRVWEGSHRYTSGDVANATFPVGEYDHGGGRCSITGGEVYRGAAVPALRGWYLYGDYCSGELWGLAGAEGKWVSAKLLDTHLSLSSFGLDAEGEVYVTDHQGGTVSRVVAG